MAALVGAPAVQDAVAAALAQGFLLHGGSAAVALAGFYLVVAPWRSLSDFAALLGRVGLTVIGGMMIVFGLFMALDPTVFGLLPGARADSEQTPFMVFAAAALLGFVGVSVSLSPWRLRREA